MNHALTVSVEILAAGAAITFVGARLIGWAHPPRGSFVATASGRQHIAEIGTGPPSAPPVVLIHGAGCNLEDMRLTLGERLASRHRVILIDRAGLGWSERRGRDGSAPAFQAAVLREVLDRLDVPRAIIAGHSWGGALAAAFALDYPERTAGLVLLAPPLYPLLRHMTWLYAVFALPLLGCLYAYTLALPLGAPFIGMALASAFLPQCPPRGYVRRTGAMLLLRPATFLANARDVADLKFYLRKQAPRYPSLAGPILIVTGSRDFIVPKRSQARTFADAVPHARLIVLPGIGHMLHHVAADRVAAEIGTLADAASNDRS